MTAKIETVRKGQKITAEAWNELVERVNALERRQAFNFTVPQKQKPVVTLALFAITWNWTNDANNVPFASASIVDTRTGAVSQVVATVFAPNGYGAGQGVERRWCVWRGRWELVTKEYKTPSLDDLGLETATISYVSDVTISNGELTFNRTSKTIVTPAS